MSNEFDPQWYLMHHIDGDYIGPFESDDQAHIYRTIRRLKAYAVVRTSKPRPARSPQQADADMARVA